MLYDKYGKEFQKFILENKKGREGRKYEKCLEMFSGCHLEKEIDLFTAAIDQRLAICRAKDGPPFSVINHLAHKYFSPYSLLQPLNFTTVTGKQS